MEIKQPIVKYEPYGSRFSHDLFISIFPSKQFTLKNKTNHNTILREFIKFYLRLCNILLMYINRQWDFIMKKNKQKKTCRSYLRF